jgi:hypothetical protein
MKEIINSNPDFDIKKDEYIRLLGYPPNYRLEGRSKELVNWARNCYNENGKPWIYAVPAKTLDTSNGKLLINNIEFSSKKLLKQLKDSDSQSAMLVAVSAGTECENKTRELWDEGKPDEYFFLEVFCSAVVEHLITTTGFIFCEQGEKDRFAVLPHYSPGYPGWAIKDQHKLLALIKQNNNFLGEISVLETGMLNPKKSLLAVFGITNHLDRVKNLHELIPCETCCLKSCQYRKSPFRQHHFQIEDICNLQTSNNKKVNLSINANIILQS